MINFDEKTNKAKIVSVMSRFLMGVPLEEHIGFLQSMGVMWTLRCTDPKPRGSRPKGMPRSKFNRKIEGRNLACIYVQLRTEQNTIETVRSYKGTGDSAKTAFCQAMTKFLLSESCDYHEYCEELRPKKPKKQRVSNGPPKEDSVDIEKTRPSSSSHPWNLETTGDHPPWPWPFSYDETDYGPEDYTPEEIKDER